MNNYSKISYSEKKYEVKVAEDFVMCICDFIKVFEATNISSVLLT